MGKLLLTLTALQSISWQLVEHIQCSKISEGYNVDSILQEMISESKYYVYSEHFFKTNFK